MGTRSNASFWRFNKEEPCECKTLEQEISSWLPYTPSCLICFHDRVFRGTAVGQFNTRWYLKNADQCSVSESHGRRKYVWPYAQWAVQQCVVCHPVTVVTHCNKNNREQQDPTSETRPIIINKANRHELVTSSSTKQIFISKICQFWKRYMWVSVKTFAVYESHRHLNVLTHTIILFFLQNKKKLRQTNKVSEHPYHVISTAWLSQKSGCRTFGATFSNLRNQSRHLKLLSTHAYGT